MQSQMTEGYFCESQRKNAGTPMIGLKQDYLGGPSVQDYNVSQKFNGQRGRKLLK